MVINIKIEEYEGNTEIYKTSFDFFYDIFL